MAVSPKARRTQDATSSQLRAFVASRMQCESPATYVSSSDCDSLTLSGPPYHVGGLFLVLRGLSAIGRTRSLVVELHIEVLAVLFICAAHEVVDIVEECESIVDARKLDPPGIAAECDTGTWISVLEIEDVVEAIGVHVECEGARSTRQVAAGHGGRDRLPRSRCA